jgi:purine-nucleoside/S-methyl-5'-thioadenosine phosphorylase / adenosine deaminase
VLKRRESSNGLVYYVSPSLEEIGVPHAFSTRIGGISPPPFDSLNLGNPSGTEVKDQWMNIYENYARLQAAIACADRARAWVHQVHGGDVIRCDGSFESGVNADALVTNDARRLLSVRVADCAPVLLASDDGRIVAAVHAGWRGVLAGVAVNAVDQMRCPASKIVAAIGPCIGFDPFEVGLEVLEAFEREFGSDAPIRRGADGKGHVDLKAALAIQLRKIGVNRIDATDRCTFAHADEFFSHRRDKGVTGRMAAMIAPSYRDST